MDSVLKGRNFMMKNIIRKVIIWRIISIIITFVLFFVMTGDFKSTSIVTVTLHFLLTVFNYLFEIVWEKYFDTE